jgi:hypothetical protein
VSHHTLQLIAGTVTEALDWFATTHQPYRLILVDEDLQPGGTYMLVGTWAARLNPAALHARLTELGIQPAHTSGWAA